MPYLPLVTYDMQNKSITIKFSDLIDSSLTFSELTDLEQDAKSAKHSSELNAIVNRKLFLFTKLFGF